MAHVKHFCVGHALELYLKAAYAKMTGNVTAAIKKSHEIDQLLRACKAEDSSFLPGWELRPSVMKIDLLTDIAQVSLGPDDFGHFLSFRSSTSQHNI